ncbi:MAG: hypothetical protein R3224_09505 [Balneolaceae bacterium]|nr:hypothetical protein [Balneolaceae bacterium]
MYRIKTFSSFLCLMLFFGAASFAQTRITIEGKTINGREARENIWVFEDSEDSLITIRRQMYRDLTQKIRELQLEGERLEKIIQAKDELIEAFENYEGAADAHIRTQAELIETADSLYLGYKDLYRDLKSIYGINTVSLLLGTGAFNFDRTEWNAVGSVGVAYKRYEGTVDFGLTRSYFGLNLQYSIPLF